MKEVIMKVPSFSADYPKAPIYVADLVRCKECRHWDTADGECYADRGIYFPKADDFCSYGVKQGADDDSDNI